MNENVLRQIVAENIEPKPTTEDRLIAAILQVSKSISKSLGRIERQLEQLTEEVAKNGNC
jgi:hypothetical protein